MHTAAMSISAIKSLLGIGAPRPVSQPIVQAPVKLIPGVAPGTPVYPAALPFVRAVAVGELMASQRDVIHEIKMQLRLKEGEFERWVTPLLERFAAFVHLLPASAEHHHSQAGGLWAHSLEVARESARLANSIELVDVDVDPVERHALLPRWRIAAMTAGLLHDIGKPISDVGAISAAGEVWNAFEMPLASWIEARAQDGYHFHWRRTKRGRMHEMFGLLGVREVMGGELLAHLSNVSGGFDILLDMLGAIVGIEAPGNRLVDLVKQADSRSVASDLERSMRGHAAVGEGGRYSLGARLMHGIKELVDVGRLSMNQPGAKVWVTDRGVFVVYPDILRVVREHLVGAGVSGIPADPIVLAETLAAQGVISVWTSDQGVSRKTFRIKVALPEGTHFAEATLTVLRLENPAAHIETIGNVAPLSALVLEGVDTTTPQLAPLPAPPSEAPAALQTPLEHTAPATTATTTPEPSQQSPAPAAAPAPAPQERSNAAISAPGTIAGRVDAATRAAIAELVVAMKTHKQAADLLSWIAEDLGTSQKRWGEHALDDGMHVALRHPLALTGYGIQPPDATAALIKADWVEADPQKPGQRRQLRQFAGVEDGAIVLKADPSRWLRAIASSRDGQSVDAHAAAAASPALQPPRPVPVAAPSCPPPAPAPLSAPSNAGPHMPRRAATDGQGKSAADRKDAGASPSAIPGPTSVAGAPVAPMPAKEIPADERTNSGHAPVLSDVDRRNAALCREMHRRLVAEFGDAYIDATTDQLRRVTQRLAEKEGLTVEALANNLRAGANPIYVHVDNATRANRNYRFEGA